jgi:transposase InsO family protein
VREEKRVAGQVPSSPPRGRPAGQGRVARYGYEIRRKAVQLSVEEGIPTQLVAKELGISDGSVENWTRKYRKYGEAGLRDEKPGGKKSKLPRAVSDKIGELKEEDPSRGSRRISDLLRRLFFMKASPSTVQKHVKAKGFVTPRRKKRRVQTLEDRRFEYSKPNQFWQSDITVFKILGRDAFIIGFIDDYSRFITGLGVYRSQTSENVIEIYRRATGEHGVPEELLTDNGRQYASWRGKTKFQKELKRDHVHHIRSQPQHPETLGKIERFWQTIKDEFLVRARFDSFEEAQERIAYWVKHYNHHRPHQSLDGLCPADRFFKIRKEVKEAIEKNMAANMEELALRGKPIEPFYMVGRVGEQSLVIETDKKKISVTVNGQKIGERGSVNEAGTDGKRTAEEAVATHIQREGKEPGGIEPVERTEGCSGPDEGTLSAVGCAARVGTAGDQRDPDGTGSGMEADGGKSRQPACAGGEAHREDAIAETANRSADRMIGGDHERNGTGQAWSDREVPGSVVGLDGTEEGLQGVQRNGNQLQPAVAVAGPGCIGYAGGVGTEGTGGSGRPSAGAADKTSAGPESQDAGTGRGWEGSAKAQGEPGSGGAGNDQSVGSLERTEANERVHGSPCRERSESPGMAESHTGGAEWPDNGHPGSPADGSQPQDLLPEARQGHDGDAGRTEGPAHWKAGQPCRSGEGRVAGGTGGQQERSGSPVCEVEDTGGYQEHLAGIGRIPARG